MKDDYCAVFYDQVVVLKSRFLFEGPLLLALGTLLRLAAPLLGISAALAFPFSHFSLLSLEAINPPHFSRTFL
jgi:hypothetical protein